MTNDEFRFIITEEFENEVMEENVYSLLPDYLVKNLRYVMLEDESNASYKAFSKISFTALAGRSTTSPAAI